MSTDLDHQQELRELLAAYDRQLDALDRRVFALGRGHGLEVERERRQVIQARAGAQHELNLLTQPSET